MNKSQAEKKVYMFYAVFRVDVTPFQNPTETSFDHFLDPQSMPKLFKKNKPMADSNFAFIDPVSAVYYGGQAGTRIPKRLRNR